MKMLAKTKYWSLSLLVVLATLGGVAATTFAEAPVKTETAVVIEHDDPIPVDDLITDEEYIDWDQIAADALGITIDELYEAYDDGKSIADLAAEQNVDPQAIAAALVTAETELINQLVADEAISQEEADEWLQYVAEDAEFYVNESWDMSFMDVEFVDWDALAADALDITIDDLYAAYDDGKSIADLAAEQNVAPQTVAAAVVTAETELINQLVADEAISQEEADEWLQYVAEDAEFYVNESWDMDFMDVEFVDWDALAANALGITVDELYAAYEDDKSIADLAAEQSVDPQTIVAALVTAETELINQLVADEAISQEEADEWLQYVAEDAEFYVNESWDMDFMDVEFVDWDALAANALGITVDELYAAYEDGKSIADLAAEQSVDPQTIVAALVTAETELINQLVADEAISQEEADEWLQYVAEDVEFYVNESWDFSFEDDGFFDEEPVFEPSG